MLGWRGRAGLIVPANNSVVLPEFYRMAPDGLTACETRMPITGALTPAAVRAMAERATECATLLAQAGVDIACYCCMSTAIVEGWTWEARLLDALSATCGRATSANHAMLSALRHLGVRRIAVITPYPAVFNTALRAHFGARGIEITALAGVEIPDVQRVREVRPETLYQLGAALDLETADAICILATDLETVSVIERLERHAGRPVVSSNQALVWDVKRQLGIGEPVAGYGRLLDAAAGDSGADGRRGPSS